MILHWNKWAIFIVVMAYNLIILNLGTVLTEHPMYVHSKVCFLIILNLGTVLTEHPIYVHSKVCFLRGAVYCRIN